MKKVVLKNFAKFTGKHLCVGFSFSNKVAAQGFFLRWLLLWICSILFHMIVSRKHYLLHLVVGLLLISDISLANRVVTFHKEKKSKSEKKWKRCKRG